LLTLIVSALDPPPPPPPPDVDGGLVGVGLGERVGGALGLRDGSATPGAVLPPRLALARCDGVVDEATPWPFVLCPAGAELVDPCAPADPPAEVEPPPLVAEADDVPDAESTGEGTPDDWASAARTCSADPCRAVASAQPASTTTTTAPSATVMDGLAVLMTLRPPSSGRLLAASSSMITSRRGRWFSDVRRRFVPVLSDVQTWCCAWRGCCRGAVSRAPAATRTAFAFPSWRGQLRILSRAVGGLVPMMVLAALSDLTVSGF
jgi:hypothetical protein